MSKIKYLFFTLLITFIFSEASNTIAQVSSNFPDGWTDRWAGTLFIYGENKVKEIYMELIIKPAEDTNHWKWTIIYGKGEFSQTRQYELILVDSSKGKYKVDEKNSIILEATYRNNTFFSTYEVEKNLITAIYSLSDNKIIFEIIK